MDSLQNIATRQGFETNAQLAQFIEDGSAGSFLINGEPVARDDVLTRLNAAPDGLIADTFEFARAEPAVPRVVAPPQLSPMGGSWAQLAAANGAGLRNSPSSVPFVGFPTLEEHVAASEPTVVDEPAVPDEPEVPDEPVHLDPPEHGYYPTVESGRFHSARMENLQGMINASGYSEATGADPLVEDGHGGDLTGDGIGWFAEASGSPTRDPNDPRFWASANAFVHSLEGDLGERARAAFDRAMGAAESAEAPRSGYPTVRSGTLNSERIGHLQRVINAAGYAELSDADALVVDRDGGELTGAGTEWLAEHVGAPSADPNTPEFWNAVHTFGARDDSEFGDTLRAALGSAIGEEISAETRVTQGPLARPPAPGGAEPEPPPDEVEPGPVDPTPVDGQMPVVPDDARNDPRMERLQTIINAAGYAAATGRAALVIDGTGGEKTTHGTQWLATEAGSPTSDPNDPRFWTAVNEFARNSGNAGLTAEVENANAWANVPEAPNGIWPTVSREANGSSRFMDLQNIINAAGYAEATGAEPLVGDGRSGPLSRAGIDWLAEVIGSPTNDPNSPLFWARLTGYANEESGLHAEALQAAVNTAHEGVLAAWPFDDSGLSRVGVQTHLPVEDPSIVSYAPQGTGTRFQWGTERTVEMVRSVAAEYQRRTGYPLMVGDISQQGGGEIDGHASHRHGRNVDFSPAFSDGRATVHFPRGDDEATWRSPNYDRDATRTMLTLLREANPGIVIFFNDPVLMEEGLSRGLWNHDNHIHIQGLR
ncbi:MAG: penicillin-insensitive murein endopeptidase [Myxococcota bacterium]